MNRKFMIGMLAVALIVGGVVGAVTVGNSFANNTPSNTAPATTSTPESGGTNEAQLLTIEQVKRIALEQVEGEARVESVELEKDWGKVYYDVEVETATHEYDIDLDAYTGEVLKIKQERDRNTMNSGSQPSVISMEQAVAIALEEVPGTFVKVERDRDDGRLYYEVEIREGRYEVEIEIDAETGDILDVEYDD